jgi:hypothetical protein
MDGEVNMPFATTESFQIALTEIHLSGIGGRFFYSG